MNTSRNFTGSTNSQPIDLGECPCGESATWYRIAPPQNTSDSLKRAASAVTSVTLDDVQENLCDGCMKGFSGSLDAAVPGWKRVDVLKRQQFAGEENQARRFDDDSQVASGDEEW